MMPSDSSLGGFCPQPTAQTDRVEDVLQAAWQLTAGYRAFCRQDHLGRCDFVEGVLEVARNQPFTALSLQMLMAWGIKLANFTNSCPETCSRGSDHRSCYLVSRLPWQGQALKGSCKSRANVERYFTGKAVHPPTICDSRTS